MHFKEFFQEATMRSKSHTEVATILKRWFFKNVLTRERKQQDVDYNFLSFEEWQDYRWKSIVNLKGSDKRIRIGSSWLKYNLTHNNIPGLDKRPDTEEWRKAVENFLNKLLKPLGWFVASISGNVTILIDPLTQKTIEDLKILYHFSPAWNKNRILKKGLIPKGSNEKYNDDYKYPPRIHLLTQFNEHEIRELAFHIFNFDLDAEEMYHGKAEHMPLVIFEIDVNKCHKNIKFYEDLAVKNGVWTYTHIPPAALKIKHEDEWEDK